MVESMFLEIGDVVSCWFEDVMNVGIGPSQEQFYVLQITIKLL